MAPGNQQARPDDSAPMASAQWLTIVSLAWAATGAGYTRHNRPYQRPAHLVQMLLGCPDVASSKVQSMEQSGDTKILNGQPWDIRVEQWDIGSTQQENGQTNPPTIPPHPTLPLTLGRPALHNQTQEHTLLLCCPRRPQAAACWLAAALLAAALAAAA